MKLEHEEITKRTREIITCLHHNFLRRKNAHCRRKKGKMRRTHTHIRESKLEKIEEFRKRCYKVEKEKQHEEIQEKSDLSFGPMLHVAGKLRRRSPTTSHRLDLALTDPRRRGNEQQR